MKDPLGVVVQELRADPVVGGIVAGRVSGEMPDPDWPEDPRPMVIVTELSVVRRKPQLQVPRYAIRCYGAGDDDDPRVAPRTSRQLYGAVSDALYLRGPRTGSGGRAIYQSTEDVGGQPGEDPGTGWPYRAAIVRLIAAAQAVA